MARERLTMRKIAKVLRLKWECGLSNRAIARSCSISHSTVAEYVRRAQEAGLSWPLPPDLGEDTLFERLFPQAAPSGSRVIPCPDWPAMHSELRKKNVTLRLLWVEYREAHPDGYGYSQFCVLYRQWAKHLQPSMRLTHKAGEKVFVDYAGQTMPIVDPHTGEVRQAQIFIGVLGASNYTYAEAHASQELANWIGAHVRMFSFLGGMSEIVVPDNLKAGVKHPCRYEPDLNPTYQDLAEHYGIAVIPTRVRKPKDKAKAEVGVQVVERWILARLRNQTFFSLAALNQAIRELLSELNLRPMEHLGRSRRELFEELDQPALKPLPELAYEFAIWKKARVSIGPDTATTSSSRSTITVSPTPSSTKRSTCVPPSRPLRSFLTTNGWPPISASRPADGTPPSRNICHPPISTITSGHPNGSPAGLRALAPTPRNSCRCLLILENILSKPTAPAWASCASAAATARSA